MSLASILKDTILPYVKTIGNNWWLGCVGYFAPIGPLSGILQTGDRRWEALVLLLRRGVAHDLQIWLLHNGGRRIVCHRE